MNTEEIIAAQLERIEAKLDAVLEKLKWAPRAEAEWYAEISHGGPQEPLADGGI
jgi:hypothetical protein